MNFRRLFPSVVGLVGEEEEMLRSRVILMSGVAFLAGCMFLTGCSRLSKPFSTESPKEGDVAQAAQAGKGEPTEEQSQIAREMTFTQAGEEMQAIYFDYDKADLKPEAIARLDKAAEWLKANPSANVQIEGHCDERGTNEYNLALGERRALAARRYLVSLGVSSERIFTVSYGEERPAVEGHDESAWQYNRRDEFKVSL
jgi:peptidoglycan-associated lipoprotein